MGSVSILFNYLIKFFNGNFIMYVNSLGIGMMILGEVLNYLWNILVYWIYCMFCEKGVDVKGYMEKMGYEILEYGIESLFMGGGIEVIVV